MLYGPTGHESGIRIICPGRPAQDTEGATVTPALMGSMYERGDWWRICTRAPVR